MQNMPTRHVIDVMHIERNIADYVLRYLFGEKDTLECRRGMEEVGVMRDLQVRMSPNGSTYIKPCAPNVLSNIERQQFLEVVGNIRMPTGYASNFNKHFGRDKFMGLKSHDLHCMIQHIIPVRSRTILHPFQRTTLIRLGKCFTRLCAKVVDPLEILGLRLFVVETVCLLEICMPPTFFDVMEHMLIHLVDDLEHCGHVGGRWLYPLEHYMGALKSLVRNKARPEASIASGYIYEETLGFCIESFELYEHTSWRVWESNEDDLV